MFSILCFLSLISTSSAQENLTTNITYVPYPTCNRPCVNVFGNILNQSFIKAFKMDLGQNIICDFVPIEMASLSESKYVVTCIWPYNATLESPIPVPAKLLQSLNITQLMGLKGENEGLKSTNFWLWVSLIIAIIVAIVFGMYYFWNEHLWAVSED